MSPKSNDWCPYERREHRDTHSGEAHVKMETEIEVMQIQLQEYQEFLATTKGWGTGMEEILSQSLQKEPTLYSDSLSQCWLGYADVSSPSIIFYYMSIQSWLGVLYYFIFNPRSGIWEETII